MFFIFYQQEYLIYQLNEEEINKQTFLKFPDVETLKNIKLISQTPNYEFISDFELTATEFFACTSFKNDEKDSEKQNQSTSF